MFSGIVQEVAAVTKLNIGHIARIGVDSGTVYEDAKPSDSICLNGACLTLTKKERKTLSFEAIASTLAKTNLKRLHVGELVNLEPALKVGERIGGHFVLGHVDKEVHIRRILKRTSFWEFEVELPSQFKKYIVENGSVALEGISLTVKKILPYAFTVDVVPFTFDHTNLKYKRAGDWLNAEFDYLLKTQINKDRNPRRTQIENLF